MPRVFVIKDERDRQALSKSLLTARLTDTQADSALADLQAANPHLNLQELSVGAVLLVPDAPSFDASASESVAGGALESFQQLVRSELGAAAKKLRESNAARAGQRADVAAVQKTAAFKRIVEKDDLLKQQLEEATKALKEDQQRAEQAEQTLDAAAKGAMEELSSLSKLLT